MLEDGDSPRLPQIEDQAPDVMASQAMTIGYLNQVFQSNNDIFEKGRQQQSPGEENTNLQTARCNGLDLSAEERLDLSDE